ncbi:MAG TPA: hypothetical protein VJQ80_01910, partial [Arthrobacter sp.]|nr:hypothetical protein [Arthrobacter sp.]
MAEEIFVYLDEGALDAHKDKATKEVNAAVPSVAAVVLHNPDSVREEILTLERKLLLDPSFRLEGNASRFKSNGFHHTHDPTVARVRFTEAMSNFSFSWYSSSLIDSRPKPLHRSIEAQYVHLISAIAQKFHDKNISFVFEQNTSLNKKYKQIVEQSLLSISSTLPSYKVSIAGKEERLLALPDYCIAISADA